MSTKHLNASRHRDYTPRRNTTYTVSEYGDSEEELVRDSKPFYDDEKNIRDLQPSATDSSLKSISHEDHSHHKFYKPLSNRTPILSIFLLVVGGCILLMELAIKTHPNSNSVTSVLRREIDPKAPEEFVAQAAYQPDYNRVASTTYHSTVHWVKRTSTDLGTTASDVTYSSAFTSDVDASTATPTITSPAQKEEAIVTAPDSDAETSPIQTPGQPNPNEQLVTDTPTTTPAVTGAPNPNSQLTTIIASPDPNKQLVTTTSNAPGQPNPNSQISITSQENANQNSKTGSQTTGITVGQPAPQSQLTVTEPNSRVGVSDASTPDKVLATVTDSNGVVSTITSAAAQLSIPQASIVSGSLIASGSSVIGTVVQSGNSNNLGAGAITLSNSDGQATATVKFTGVVMLTNSNGQVTATVSYTAPKASISTSAGQNTVTSQQNPVTWTRFSYFFAKYLPNILAVILQATWLIIFATFKMMEPFYQLASPQGAMAESSLTADYLSAGLSLSFAKAALDGHWVMVLAGLTQLLLAFIVSLSSDAFNIIPTAFCKTELTDRQPCAPQWVVNLSIARGVEVLLIGCFSMILMIIVLNLRRVSGVYTDPSKIATMADVLVHKPFIQELRDIPASATKAEIELDLKDNRYMLGTFIANGRQQYGIIKLNNAPQSFDKEPYMTRLGRRFDFWWESVVNSFEERLPYASDFVCMLLALALFSVVLSYYCIPGADDSNPLNTFMGKHKVRFGASFLLSMLAVSMGFLLKHKERAYRLSHPYVVMSKGPQPAHQCITSGTHSTQYTALPKSIHSRDFTLALLSMAAILSDVNLLLVPGIPWTPAQTTEVYKNSTYGCLVILAIIMMVHTRVTFKQWKRGHHVESPDTLAAVLMRLCGSHFVEEKNWQASHGPISRREFWQDDDERQRLRYEGVEKERKYRFGCMEGVDGVQRYMIEEDVGPKTRQNTSS